MKRERLVTKPTIRLRYLLFLILMISGFAVVFQQFQIRRQLLAEKKEVSLEVQRLQKEIEDLKHQISKSGSLEFVERVAREEYGMIRRGEIIYVNVNREIGPYGKFFAFE